MENRDAAGTSSPLRRRRSPAILAGFPMTLKNLGRFAVALAACWLLNGCRSDFHLLLFNDTNSTIVIRRRLADRVPLVVVAGISGELTGLSADDFSLERNGKMLRYHFPLAYMIPSATVPPGYERKVPRIGKSYYFQLAPDNRIYILRRNEALSSETHPAQPAGFPLSPY